MQFNIHPMKTYTKFAPFASQTKAAFEYLEIEKNVNMLVKDTATALVRVVRKNSFYLIDDYLSLDQNKLITYNPSKGELDFQIWMPMELPSLQVVKTFPSFI